MKAGMTRPVQRDKTRLLANYEICAAECVVVQDNGSMVVMRTSDAIAEAAAASLDLVQIGYDKNTRRPVCKFADHSKMMYERQKQEKLRKKQSKAKDVKTIQIGLMADTNDRNRQLARARECLAHDGKVKIAITFKSRAESRNTKYAAQVQNDVLAALADTGILQPGTVPAKTWRELSFMLIAKK